MFRFLFVLSLLVSAGSLAAQGWERVYDGGGGGQLNDIARTQDGGYISVGYYNNLNRARLFKSDADGYLQWTKDFYIGSQPSAEAVIVAKNKSGYVFTGFYTLNNTRQVYLIKTDLSGNLVWQRQYSSNYDAEGLDVTELPDGSFALCGYQKSINTNEDIWVIKTNSTGAMSWSKTFGENLSQEKGYGIAVAADGNLIIAGERKGSSSGGGRDIYVLKIESASGAQIWEKIIDLHELVGTGSADDAARDLVVDADGGIVIAGRSTAIQGGAGVLLKINASGTGNPLWTQLYPKTDFYGLAKSITSAGFWVTGNKTTTSAQEDLYILRTDAEGDKVCDVLVGRPGIDRGYGIVPTSDGGALAAGTGEFFFPNSTSTENPYLVKTDKNCLVFTSYMAGHIFHDLNNNCELDSGEPGLEDWILKIESPNFTRYAATTVNGDFQLLVDTGTYQIKLFPPNDYWETCDPITILSVNGFSDTFPVNIPVSTKFACPRNEVDIATPVLRRCTDNEYTVRYCNSGTLASNNTQIEVTLDPDLTYKNSSIPFAQQTGNTFIFNVGLLENGDCGSFTITAFLDCGNTVTGQTHCVNAHIYPDSFCNASATWDGSIVSAGAVCENDSIKFSLKNIGSSNMDTPVGFVITEDVIMLTDPNDPMYSVKLLAGQDSVVWHDVATGSTFRIIAQQTPGYPAKSYPTAAVEGCKSATSDTISRGFYTMFAQDDAEPFKSSDCQESNNTDFNPPYLKRGHPKGLNAGHYIPTKYDLEFLIQFQNTGTDTVHQVVIRDTLSSYLDPATVHPGAASHPYDFDIYGNGIVQFTLPNLNLPPGSSVSEGYVKFRVSQMPNLPCETVIFNNAAIYFDFTAPVLTNQTFHTVCNDSVLVPTINPYFAGADVKVYPNPFDESTTFEISGVPAPGFAVELYDMLGRKVFNQVYSSPTFRLYRHQLPAGMLFYRLTTEKGKPVASGKLLVR